MIPEVSIEKNYEEDRNELWQNEGMCECQWIEISTTDTQFAGMRLIRWCILKSKLLKGLINYHIWQSLIKVTEMNGPNLVSPSVIYYKEKHEMYCAKKLLEYRKIRKSHIT